MTDAEFDFSGLDALIESQQRASEQLRAAPQRYAPLDPEADGVWQFVLSSGLPVALIWTDWKEAFGVLTLVQGDVTNEFHEYAATGKKLDIPAGWAYSTVELFVLRFVNSTVTLSPKFEGKLAGAWDAASGASTSKEEVPSES